MTDVVFIGGVYGNNDGIDIQLVDLHQAW